MYSAFLSSRLPASDTNLEGRHFIIVLRWEANCATVSPNHHLYSTQEYYNSSAVMVKY